MIQQINLFNEEISGSGKEFSVMSMVQGVALILIGAMLFYGWSVYQTSHMEQQLEEINKKLAAEQAKLATLVDEYSRQRAGLTLEQELKKLESEATTQREIIDTLKSGVIGNTKGYSGYMHAFARQTINGLWLTGFSIDGDAKQMSISGAALSPELVPGYIMRLNNEAVMRGKTFSSLQMQLPKVDAAQTPTTQYLEFILKSVGAGEADK